MASGPHFGAIFGHFEPFWALLGLFLTLFGHLGGGKGSKCVRTPKSWGKMVRGEWVPRAQVASRRLLTGALSR